MTKYIYIFFLFCSKCLLAQNHQIVFLDSLTKEPIAYYRIFNTNNEYVGYGDSIGVCNWQQNIDNSDTLFLYHISYARFLFNKNISQDTFYVAKLSYTIDEILVKSSVTKEEIKVGCNRIKTGVNFLGPTTIVGINIPGTYSNKNAFIKSFNVHIYKDSYQPDQKFRIHLFSVDKNNIPGTDIIPYDIYANGSKKGGWVEIDLSKLKIKIPEGGLVAAIECLGSPKSNEIYYNNLKRIKNGEITEISYLYDIQVSSGDKFINGNEEGYWAKRGIWDWKQINPANLTLFPSIYLKIEIEK